MIASCPGTRTGRCSTNSALTRAVLGWRETEVAQPANFAIQVALAEQLKQFGITPDAVIGHSAGEVAAHYLAGVLTFEQAIHVIYHRSRLQQRTSGQGRMLAVGLGAEVFMQTIDAATLDDIGQRVSIAAINGPSAVTVAGDSDALNDIARQLDERRDLQSFPDRKGALPHPLHGRRERRPLRRLRRADSRRRQRFRCTPRLPANGWTATATAPPIGGKTLAPQSFSSPLPSGCSTTATRTSSSSARTLFSPHRCSR